MYRCTSLNVFIYSTRNTFARQPQFCTPRIGNPSYHQIWSESLLRSLSRRIHPSLLPQPHDCRRGWWCFHHWWESPCELSATERLRWYTAWLALGCSQFAFDSGPCHCWLCHLPPMFVLCVVFESVRLGGRILEYLLFQLFYYLSLLLLAWLKWNQTAFHSRPSQITWDDLPSTQDWPKVSVRMTKRCLLENNNIHP